MKLTESFVLHTLNGMRGKKMKTELRYTQTLLLFRRATDPPLMMEMLLQPSQIDSFIRNTVNWTQMTLYCIICFPLKNNILSIIYIHILIPCTAAVTMRHLCRG